VITSAAQSNVASRVEALFDTRQVCAIFNSVLPTKISAVRLERYWPESDGEISFEWSMESRCGDRITVHGRTLRNPSDNAWMGCDLASDDLRSLRLYLPQWRLVLHSPDHDMRLPKLASGLDPYQMTFRLRQLRRECLLHQRREPARIHDSAKRDSRINCRLRAYRAGRRAVIAYGIAGNENPANVVIGKMYRKARVRRLAHLHQSVNNQFGESSRGRIRVPPPLGIDPDLEMVVYPMARGISPDGPRAGDLAHIPIMGEILALLHRTWVANPTHYGVADEMAVLERWHRLLQQARPALARTLNRLLDRLCQLSGSVVAEQRRTIHRDFYGAQILLTRRTATLLDLDTLSRGDPSVDLGNMLAHVALDLLRYSGNLRPLNEIANRLIDKYESLNGPLNRRSLAFYCASAASRVGAVHAARTVTGPYVPKLWAFAEDVLIRPPWRTQP
jgi:hypothetical protein